jgi:hypothetical protein
MEAIASLARQANKSQAACSSTDTSGGSEDGSDDSGIAAVLRSEHVPPPIQLAAATNEQEDSDFQPGGSAVTNVHHFESMIKMARAYKSYAGNGEDCHLTCLRVADEAVAVARVLDLGA